MLTPIQSSYLKRRIKNQQSKSDERIKLSMFIEYYLKNQTILNIHLNFIRLLWFISYWGDWDADTISIWSHHYFRRCNLTLKN
ncbi:hypothetical protein [Legionella qingyii]|uniref:hypothetical protein n=1 Tax=Legionella qingyii TaxID=2184757 RepID=UPI00197CAED3|nr:hypothetical protein [Legionella qingyii]